MGGGGGIEVVGASEHRYHTLHLSPDGKSFAADESGNNRIWIHDLDRGTRVLAVSGSNQMPRFKPDGTVIAYADQEGIFVKPADGTGESRLLVTKEHYQTEPSWSPDGSVLAFTEVIRKRGATSGSFRTMGPRCHSW